MHQIKRTKKEQRWCVTIKTYCKILFVLNAVSGVYLCVSVRVWLTYKTFAAYKLNQMLDIEWPITTRLYYYCFFLWYLYLKNVSILHSQECCTYSFRGRKKLRQIEIHRNLIIDIYRTIEI